MDYVFLLSIYLSIYIYIYEGYSQSSKHFCYEKTLWLFIKQEKILLLPGFISVLVRLIPRWEVHNKSKIGQNKDQSSHKVCTKERYDTQGNQWEHGTDTWWELPFQCNCEEVGSRIQVGTAQKMILSQIIQNP